MTQDHTTLRELAEEFKTYGVDIGDIEPNQGSTYCNKLVRNYLEAASPDVVLEILSELKELRLAYAEASRQKNELLTAHKVNARERDADREAMRVALDALCGADMIDVDMAKSIDALRARLEN
jgi:hypothetical protein